MENNIRLPKEFPSNNEAQNNSFNYIANLILKCKKYVIKLWNDKITNPIAKRKDEIEKLKNKLNIKKDFENRFGLSVEGIKKIMNLNPPKEFVNTDLLTEELIKGKKYINVGVDISIKRGVSKAPLFYDPEICEIHNENPDRESYSYLSDVKRNDSRIAENMLRYPNNAITLKQQKRNKIRASFLWKSRM